MELLLGCGTNWKKKITWPGVPADWVELVTLDWDETLNPHIVHDLNITPYPLNDNYFDEVHAYEVLEHFGKQGDFRGFFEQFAEFWRILKPNGYFVGSVPMWDTEWAWGDPGHVRVITPGTLLFLSQKQYKEGVGKTAMNDYRHIWNLDFDIMAMNEHEGTLGFVLQAIKPDKQD